MIISPTPTRDGPLPALLDDTLLQSCNGALTILTKRQPSSWLQAAISAPLRLIPGPKASLLKATLCQAEQKATCTSCVLQHRSMVREANHARQALLLPLLLLLGIRRTAMALTLTSRSECSSDVDVEPYAFELLPHHVVQSLMPLPALLQALLCQDGQGFAHAVPTAGSTQDTTPATVCLLQYCGRCR